MCLFFSAVESKRDEFCCSFFEISLISLRFWVETNFCQNSGNQTSPTCNKQAHQPIQRAISPMFQSQGEVLIGGWSMTEVSLIRVSSASLTSTLVFVKPWPWKRKTSEDDFNGYELFCWNILRKTCRWYQWGFVYFWPSKASFKVQVGANTITTCLV